MPPVTVRPAPASPSVSDTSVNAILTTFVPLAVVICSKEKRPLSDWSKAVKLIGVTIAGGDPHVAAGRARADRERDVTGERRSPCVSDGASVERGVVDRGDDAVVEDRDRAGRDLHRHERLGAVAERELDVGQRDRDRRRVLDELEVALERLAGDAELDADALDGDLLGRDAGVDADDERARERDARDVDGDVAAMFALDALRRDGERARSRRRRSTKSRSPLPIRRPTLASETVVVVPRFSNAKSAVRRWPAISIVRPVSEARRYGPAGSCRRCVWPPMVNASLTAVAMVLMAKPTCDRPGLDAVAELDRGGRAELARDPGLRDQEAAAALRDRDADVARAEEERDVRGGDADDRRVVGGVEDLVGAGAEHALEGERAAELLAGDLDQVGGRRADLDAQRASA